VSICPLVDTYRWAHQGHHLYTHLLRPDGRGILSITHKFSAYCEAQLDIDQERHAPPDHPISGWTTPCACQVATQSSEFAEVSRKPLSLRLPFFFVFHQLVEQVDFQSRESQGWGNIRHRPVHHREPENPPTEDAKDRDQIGQSLCGGTIVGGVAGAIGGAAAGSRIGTGVGAAVGALIGALLADATCNSGRQTKCALIGTDKTLRGCIYACDDGTLWFQAGPCSAYVYRDWGTGVPNR
jgi:hypothetical protein